MEEGKRIVHMTIAIYYTCNQNDRESNKYIKNVISDTAIQRYSTTG